ncbi:hypothetical protein HYPSUDRAFT_205019 [Hypholoma sublateritium FD-334 SS-4]|uniref:Zinc/iron permease n=1 Tax=Hypholoma sublateritium (strain FD-334 SS-4) TaxID=945553 RepID=A0A0D2M6U5_HYPSF|nr:hypothetical protein HYPSUDRAFT_205019 [Hypholoma sublateritium FD-334 SS-4]
MDQVAAMDLISEPRKLGVMLVILFVSLFAVSFPTISKQIPCLRIPGIIFFIGKHFGTGVILATAFIHLLDDAFSSLQSPKVEQKYHHLGKWTGSIILGSLLTIFLIEYVSTTFVEYLHDKPSAPPSPGIPALPTRPRSLAPSKAPSEGTPLLEDHDNLPAVAKVVIPIEVINNSPRICRLSIAHDHVHEHHPHVYTHLSEEEDELELEQAQEHAHPRIGRQRQIVGILVLQLGIMIHSLVIGMTLALTTGAEFTSLTTAVVFHQLFEGFSLGIRIAAIPAKAKEAEEGSASGGTLAVEEVLLDPSTGDLEAASNKARSPKPSTNEAHWLKSTLSFLFGVTTPAGMALGMTLWPSNAPGHGGAKMLLVQGVMSAISAGMLIYAATVEMLAGDFVFGDVEGGHHHHHHAHDDDEDNRFGHEHEHSRTVHMHEAQPTDHKWNGRQHHHEHNGTGHSAGQTSRCPPPFAHGESGGHRDCDNGDMEQNAGPNIVGTRAAASSPTGGAHGHGEGTKKASMGKRVLAVVSLLAGVGMMVLVGLGE